VRLTRSWISNDGRKDLCRPYLSTQFSGRAVGLGGGALRAASSGDSAAGEHVRLTGESGLSCPLMPGVGLRPPERLIGLSIAEARLALW